MTKKVIPYCTNYEEDETIKAFVKGCWFTPGILAIEEKRIRKNPSALLKDLGHYDPIIDLSIRGCVNQMLVLHFSEITNDVIGPNGFLSCFLMEKFKNSQFVEVIKQWFKSDFFTEVQLDYRNRRCSIIKAQVNTIMYQPRRIVSYKMLHKIIQFNVIIFFTYHIAASEFLGKI